MVVVIKLLVVGLIVAILAYTYYIYQSIRISTLYGKQFDLYHNTAKASVAYLEAFYEKSLVPHLGEFIELASQPSRVFLEKWAVELSDVASALEAVELPYTVKDAVKMVLLARDEAFGPYLEQIA